MERRVIIAGGGLAGCAAATVLAERGVPVTLIEKEQFLGGRVGSWPDRLRIDGTELHMERGFHAFFRQYYCVRALLRRIDPALSMLRPLHDYPLVGPGGWTESFADLPRTPPFNLLSLIWRTPSLRLDQLVGIDGARAAEMLAFDPSSTYRRWDFVTAKEYLDSLGFPPRARQMLFEVFAHSFFNPEDDYSAAELLAMFHSYFLGNREGLVFDVLREPFSVAVWDPLERYLVSRGAQILKAREVLSVTRERAGLTRVRTDQGDLEGTECILALSVPALRRVIARSPELGDPSWRGDIDALRTTRPFAVWRLWLKRPLRDDRAPFAGTTGFGILDNISIYEKVEAESARWASRTGGSVVELHAYGLPEGVTEEEIRAQLRAGWIRAYPEAASIEVLEDRFLLRDDCPGFAPGSHGGRPEVRTPADGLYLAGDFVKTAYPSALMERACSTGFSAANAILEQRGLPLEPIRHVDVRGALAGWKLL